MDDGFLSALRRDPPPEFSRRLRASLPIAAEDDHFDASRRFLRWGSIAASIAVVGFALSLPSVRAGAEAFLDLFRVVNFAPITFDAEGLRERLGQLDLDEFDPTALVGGQPRVITAPDGPVAYATVEEAGEAAGIHVREPAWMPVGWSRSAIEVVGEYAAEGTASTDILELLMVQLGITDLTVPAGLDGATFSVSVPPLVHTRYEGSDAAVEMLQARTPEVSFPAGVDLASLAEIGLRIIGLDRDEAYRLAWTIDWRTTLIVPVPVAEATFENVHVGGSDALLIRNRQGQHETVLLWSADNEVFALSTATGTLQPFELLEIAQSAQ